MRKQDYILLVIMSVLVLCELSTSK